MVLHRLRAGSPVVTDTGCCPSAARTAPDLRDHDVHTLTGVGPSYLSKRLSDAASVGSWLPLMTARALCGPVVTRINQDRGSGSVGDVF
jgi:hypothetical protein